MCVCTWEGEGEKKRNEDSGIDTVKTESHKQRRVKREKNKKTNLSDLRERERAKQRESAGFPRCQILRTYLCICQRREDKVSDHISWASSVCPGHLHSHCTTLHYPTLLYTTLHHTPLHTSTHHYTTSTRLHTPPHTTTHTYTHTYTTIREIGNMTWHLCCITWDEHLWPLMAGYGICYYMYITCLCQSLIQ